MIWLAWRRHRLSLIVVASVFAVLCIWMALNAHSFDHAVPTSTAGACLGNITRCNLFFHGWASAQQQSGLIDLLLFVIPCVVGVVLGAPLVAGELRDHTNRLAWTQGISRTRWLVVKWLVVGLSAVVLVALLQLVVQWWTGHVLVNFLETHPIPGNDRIQPRVFNITGIVPIAYTLFAFALGAALGAIVRRVGWAIVGTVVLYGVASLAMVIGIRPSLVAPDFAADTAAYSGTGQLAWDLGPGYRFTGGGVRSPGAGSVGEIVQSCQYRTGFSYPGYPQCLSAHGVQEGRLYQPTSHYWPLQWAEAAVYVGAALVLLGLTVWAVRRWRS